MVAPYVGAWVETVGIDVLAKIAGVAPYVGAWVETGISHRCLRYSVSHLTWVRGLKRCKIVLASCRIRRTLRGCVG